MRIALASDLHHEFYETPPQLSHVDADVLVLAGDIETVKSHDDDWWNETCSHYETVVFIRGNHEYYESYYRDYPSLYFPNNVIKGFTPSTHFSLLGFNWMIGTMWTDLSNPMHEMLAKEGLNDYRQIKYDHSRYWFTPEDTTREFQSFKSALEHYKPDIVVSHHLPSYGSVDPQYKDDRLNCAYATEMDTDGVKLWMHGHTHHQQQWYKGDTHIVCNPRGYPGQNPGKYELKVINV